MREQSAWLLPATPRARREEETVGAKRRGPAAAATSKRGPCSRASERFPQPRPPLLTPPPPALGPPQQFAGSAATEGAGRRSPELVRSAQSRSRRHAGPGCGGQFRAARGCGRCRPPRARPRTPRRGLRCRRAPAAVRSSGRRIWSRRTFHAAAPQGAGRITAPRSSRQRTGKASPDCVSLTRKRRGKKGVCVWGGRRSPDTAS